MDKFERSAYEFTATSGEIGTSESATGGLPFRLTDYVGGTYRGKTIFSQEQVIQQIDSGYSLDAKNGVITYSFLDGPHTIGLYNNPNEDFHEPGGYSPMSAAEQAVVRQAMTLWDDIIAPKFVEKNGNGADIVYANTTTGPAQAWAYYPETGKYNKVSSDVWTADPSVNWTNQWLNYSGYGWTTIMHESGHTFGLSHPGAYNGAGATTYLGMAEYAQDSRQYSVMSYWSAMETGARPIDVAVGLANYPQTPMIDDILTAQAKYGADLTTRATDTVYGFNSTAGNPIYDFTKNMAPDLAIYDAGGNDTIDMSGANSGVFLDLRPGSFSSGTALPTLAQANAATAAFNAATDERQGDFALWTQSSYDAYITAVGNNRAAQILAATGVSDVRALSYANISIAYNTTIENAIGGSARDYLVGNDVANRLTGNGGNDVLNGLGGDDFLSGGTGADEFRFFANSGNDKIIDFVSGTDKIVLNEIDANTLVAGDQAFTLGGSSFTNVAGELISYTSSGAHILAGDVNGDGIADFTIDLGASNALAGDFFL